MVSTHPELPVKCCTLQAMAIRIESASAIAARASRYNTVMRNPGNPEPSTRPSRNTHPSTAGFSGGFHLIALNPADLIFFPAAAVPY